MENGNNLYHIVADGFSRIRIRDHNPELFGISDKDKKYLESFVEEQTRKAKERGGVFYDGSLIGILMDSFMIKIRPQILYPVRRYALCGSQIFCPCSRQIPDHTNHLFQIMPDVCCCLSRLNFYAVHRTGNGESIRVFPMAYFHLTVLS